MLVNTIERDARYDGWKAGIAEGKSLGLAEGKLLGVAEGKSKGSLHARLETARNLLSMGLSIENIAKATGLTLQEVQAL